MTYKEIQQCYYKQFNRTLKTCWIADVKRERGFTTRIAYNRIDSTRVKYPCENQEINKWLIEILSSKSAT
jgi:hypothetical protein